MKVKLKKQDVGSLVKLTFPDYRGRKFYLDRRETHHFQNYWDGGSRQYVCAFAVINGHLVVREAANFNPITDSRAHGSFEIPRNVILVEHSIFCGKDLGITLIVHPQSECLPELLPNIV